MGHAGRLGSRVAPKKYPLSLALDQNVTFAALILNHIYSYLFIALLTYVI